MKDLKKTCNYVFILNFDNYTKNPKLYLTNIFQVQCNLPNTVKFVPEFEYKSWPEINKIPKLHFPKTHIFESYYDLDEFLRYLHKPFKIVIINNKTGLRTYAENNEQLFITRANELDSFIKYLFFCLNRIYNDQNM